MKRFSSALPYSKKWSSGNPEIDRFLEEAKSISAGSKLKNSTTIESTLNSQESSSTYLTTNKSLDFEKEFREVSDDRVQIMNAEYHRKAMAKKIFAGKVESEKKKHPEAIYSSRQFEFMDLPLPKNSPEPLSAQSDNHHTTNYYQRQTISPTIPMIMSPKTRIQKIYSAKIKSKNNVNNDQ
ncbi:25148_t:CDS:2 [Dentiscutata erythropus]|uniref:25148_t:CDS:1 n=1 Tax=Dentiscutata erythropus TaxID=1348616 RepID=A0A9N9IEF8_9GLOM|nr:25148_t:CDS:2 [Dentiscutata erythropus]